ncbi:hypothetical protein E6Q11_03340 [Candidatus Dojkabacteria bacterium]|uniref:Uncharacterized protein n=1 Tax=Candidatus Dojkabacteria bacterium TaxID=2099670 RepID=A0A5C7J6N9_9BACT|nr:MAG: hypothetical protein E6Q11_03340 [Candidatus Dojkabacteria bacterium]
MATFNKFNSFVEALAEKQHNLGLDTLVIALTNTAPTSANTQLSDITQIAYTNLSSRTLTVSSSAQTSGLYKLVVNDITLTSTGGSTGPFRYIVIYNDTSTNDLLIGYYDYGSAQTLSAGQSLTVDFDATNGLLTLQ